MIHLAVNLYLIFLGIISCWTIKINTWMKKNMVLQNSSILLALKLSNPDNITIRLIYLKKEIILLVFYTKNKIEIFLLEKTKMILVFFRKWTNKKSISRNAYWQRTKDELNISIMDYLKNQALKHLY